MNALAAGHFISYLNREGDGSIGRKKHQPNNHILEIRDGEYHRLKKNTKLLGGHFMKKRFFLLGVLLLLFSVLVWSTPGFSTLNVVVRDAKYPCKPYASSGHNFAVFVFNCDMSIHAAKWLTGTGPSGGKIYGDVKVPNGTYLVIAMASCKNVVTNWVYVNACCGKEVCVDLVPRKFMQCLSEVRVAIHAAQILGIYHFNSPAQKVDRRLRQALERADSALAELMEFFPDKAIQFNAEALVEAKGESDKELMRIIKVPQNEEK